MVEDRYSQIKEKLKYRKQEEVDINIEEHPKKIISVYESNIDMFLDKAKEKLDEFLDLCHTYQAYNEMSIVTKAKEALDAFEPIIFNQTDYIEYLHDLLSMAVGKKEKEQKIADIGKKTPKELTMETVLALKEKGFSVRRIARQLKVNHMQVQRLVEKAKEDGLLQKTDDDTEKEEES